VGNYISESETRPCSVYASSAYMHERRVWPKTCPPLCRLTRTRANRSPNTYRRFFSRVQSVLKTRDDDPLTYTLTLLPNPYQPHKMSLDSHIIYIYIFVCVNIYIYIYVLVLKDRLCLHNNNIILL